MPAEWEPHEATWIAWPHNTQDWPGKFATIPWVYAEIVRKLVDGERVSIIIQSRRHEQRARRILSSVGVDLQRVRFFRFATDRGWTRDFGPMFLRKPGTVAIINFRFNGWAKYGDWKRDAKVHRSAARALGVQLFEPTIGDKPFVLEGGAIEVNGRGTLLTTEECLLDQATQVRNPGSNRADIEEGLRAYLGVSNIVWLGKGISGDDTHGHVDDLARFVSPSTIVVCEEKNPSDPNYRALRENMERLENMRLESGSRPDVVSLPMPEPLVFRGTRLPASYANFYIANSCVLVPTFNDPNDRRALGILSDVIRDRPVVGIHAVDLVWGFGTIHCMTQQQPALSL